MSSLKVTSTLIVALYERKLFHLMSFLLVHSRPPSYSGALPEREIEAYRSAYAVSERVVRSNTKGRSVDLI
jgi:hypothetical protein